MYNNIKKDRDSSFDFIKGILIFLVVWGHSIQFIANDFYQYNPIYIWIYSFHMPLFVFISGYFSINGIKLSFREFVLQKVRRLLIPAILWTLIFFGVKVIFGQISITSLWGGVQELYNSARNAWFLYCLFALNIMARLVYMSPHKVALTLFILLIGYISNPYQPVDVLKHFQIFRQWPLFMLGLFSRDFECMKYFTLSKNNKRSIIIFILMAGIYIIWFYFAAFKHQYLFSEEHYIIRGIILVLASIIFFNVFKMLYEISSQKHLALPFICLGKNTLGIYMSNYIVIRILIFLVGNGFSEIVVFGLSIAITLICFIITKVLRLFTVSRKYLLGEK